MENKNVEILEKRAETAKLPPRRSRLYNLVKDYSVDDFDEKLREARKNAYDRYTAHYEGKSAQ